MKFLSLSNAIKLMIAIGVIAVFVLAVQSCQSKKYDDIIRVSEKTLEISKFRKGSLKTLKALEAPPVQPMTIFTNISGQSIKLADFKGQYVLLNVWASWCPPCVVEMPSLNALASQYSGDKFVVLTVSMDQTDDVIETFFQKNELAALTKWRDPDLNLASKLKARGLPITIIYNPAGDEIARVSGEANWMSDEAQALIREILGKG